MRSERVIFVISFPSFRAFRSMTLHIYPSIPTKASLNLSKAGGEVNIAFFSCGGSKLGWQKYSKPRGNDLSLKIIRFYHSSMKSSQDRGIQTTKMKVNPRLQLTPKGL